MKKILAIVVTYFPEKELLCKNISAFIDYVDRVLIWENTPSDVKLQYRFVDHEKVEYCGDGINSISHALNYAWRYAQRRGYNYLLTMDQDSVWDNFNFFLKKTVYSEDAPFGIWGPNVNSFRKDGVEKTDILITSGMVIPVVILSKIGGWNELFEIDSVDDELCCKARKAGYNLYKVTNARLIQKFGNPQEASFMGHHVMLRNDSPERLYSIFKTHVILLRMYPKTMILKNNFKNWIKRIKWILVFENRKYLKFKAIILGVYHGMKYKLD